jgi:hypothetical protein
VAELSLRDAVLEDAGEIALIHVAAWRTAYRGLIADAWVLAGNAGARAFYVRHGFELTGESDQWHGADEVRMRLVLTS